MTAQFAKAGMEQLKAQFSASDLRFYEAAFNVLDSMYLDYHDTKGHPTMSLKDHCDFYQLDEAQATFVRENIIDIRLTVKELKDAGVPPESSLYDNLPDDLVYRDALEIKWEGHRLVCFYLSRRYLDLTNPNVLYS